MATTVQDILAGTHTGRRQAVGNMEVIPILGEDDNTFAPPNFEVSNTAYGQVNLRNPDDRPTIASPGSGWIVDARVQDHAIGGGAIVPAKKSFSLRGYCIEQTQPGLIQESQKKEMIILPAAIRTAALSARKEAMYSYMWSPISAFRARSKKPGSGDMKEYLQDFAKELDQFVAQFELVPNQVGSVVLINGTVVGVERAPSNAFWKVLWEPLIRVCYGSCSLVLAPEWKRSEAKPFKVATLEGLKEAFGKRVRKDMAETSSRLRKLMSQTFRLNAEHSPVQTGDKKSSLLTAANIDFAGQFVRYEDNRVPYASLVATKFIGA